MESGEGATSAFVLSFGWLFSSSAVMSGRGSSSVMGGVGGVGRVSCGSSKGVGGGSSSVPITSNGGGGIFGGGGMSSSSVPLSVHSSRSNSSSKASTSSVSHFFSLDDDSDTLHSSFLFVQLSSFNFVGVAIRSTTTLVLSSTGADGATVDIGGFFGGSYFKSISSSGAGDIAGDAARGAVGVDLASDGFVFVFFSSALPLSAFFPPFSSFICTCCIQLSLLFLTVSSSQRVTSLNIPFSCVALVLSTASIIFFVNSFILCVAPSFLEPVRAQNETMLTHQLGSKWTN